MRICLVTPYDLCVDGGVNRHVRGLGAALAKGGDEVRVIGPASGIPPPGCEAVAGTVALPANGSVARIGLWSSPRATLERIAGFDVVHVHEPLVPGPSRHALRADGPRRVATFHAYAEREGLVSRAVRRLASGPLARLDAALAVSAPAASFAARVYPGPIEVIPNGLEVADFPPRPVPLEPRAVPRLLFVGRFSEPRKGLEVLLGASARLQAMGRPVEVLIAGDGDRERFEPAALRGAARFLGRLSDAELATAYADADLLCAPSLGGESFGLVLVEAMAAGCPVVASDIAGYAAASAGAALLVPPGDAEGLATALDRALHDPTLQAQLRERGRFRAEQLDWSLVARRVRAVYASGVGPRAAA
jgi:phosphatidylinositol alpha-mannosyltransferase